MRESGSGDQVCSRCTQWIAAWQTIETTMNAIVKSTVRGESVVAIELLNTGNHNAMQLVSKVCRAVNLL